MGAEIEVDEEQEMMGNDAAVQASTSTLHHLLPD